MSVPRPTSPTASQLFLVFAKIGLTSFGGGLSGWLMREFVQSRGWITEEEFLNGLAMSQSLPGVNVTNMAIWIGYRLRGATGALAGVAGIVLPPAILIIGIAVAFAAIEAFPLTHLALDGAAAAAIGLSASMGITAARRLPRKVLPLAIMAATFVAIGVMHWSLPVVIVAAVPASVVLTALASRGS